MSPIVPHAIRFLLAAQDRGAPLLERLKPEQRVAVIMALVGLTLIGLFLVIFVMVGGHWVRKLARHRPGKRKGHIERSTVNRQLRESLAAFLPEQETDDTIGSGKSPPETKVDS